MAKAQELDHNLARAALLAAGGITFTRQAKLLQKAVDKLEAKLEAKKVEVISFQGQVTDTVELEDNAAQLRASEAIVDLLGAKPSKQGNDGQGDVIVNIVFPAACQPTMAIDVSTGQTPLQVVEQAQTLEALPVEVNEINTLPLDTSLHNTRYQTEDNCG